MNKHLFYLERCVEIADEARKNGNMPFGALLVDEEGTILLEQGNIEVTEHVCTGHAETTLAQKASILYDKKDLKKFTLYTTVEPCVMCSGAIYWANIGKVVFALSEEKLLSLTGNDKKNLTFSLPCKKVFSFGQKNIKVIGPFEELEDKVKKSHIGFWSKSDC
ncbi:nucleoside deaminase [Enterococcus faecalis]|uniref:nucleoside deaminase n=1 Tax=Enterococcus faecalis TaxID=1351 RepID=UPI0034CDC0CD